MTNDSITTETLLASGKRTLQEATEAITRISQRLDNDFAHAAQILLSCEGRVVVTGMGKSGLIGRKIASTLASTGTPALFLHPGEALHGDLGMIAPANKTSGFSGDIALALSYSGETDELRAILPALKRRARSLIAITGNPESSLARAADVTINVAVPKEACPHNLAPTTSTTAMIAMGDALAITLMEARQFSKGDYAQLHPAGTLGRRLLLRVADVMRTGNNLAVIGEAATLADALFAITKAGAGAACVTNEHGKLSGILTDGDIRRFLLRVGDTALKCRVADAMSRTPRITSPERLAVEAFDQFENDTVRLGDLPVVSEDGRPIGILTLKDLVHAGIVLPEGGNL